MPRGKPSSVAKCCTCNGAAAKCIGCKCAKSKRQCLNCGAPGCTNKDVRELVTSIPTSSSSQNHESSSLTAEPSIHDMYNTVIHWKPDSMSLPNCGASNMVIDMLADFYREATTDGMDGILALKKATIFSRCVLQKIPTRKTSLIRKTLEVRMSLWKEGKVSEVFFEARTLQQRRTLEVRQNRKTDWKKKFIKLITNGKVTAAAAILDDGFNNSLISPETIVQGKSVAELLQELHPSPGVFIEEACLHDKVENAKDHHSTLFLTIDADSIIRAARKTFGGAGPSGLDSSIWKNMLMKHALHSRMLAEALAGFARMIASRSVNPSKLEAFVACRLIAIPKKGNGIRPIGISEVVRRIISKTILELVREDLQDVSGKTQLCASQRSGLEFAIHSLRDSFNSNQQYGLLAVDAKNAFNMINRNVLLKNVKHICPGLAQTLSNVYSLDAELVTGVSSIWSREGVTQGDPLAMAAFAVASMPIISRIANLCPSIMQRWYADDANFVGNPYDLDKVWTILCDEGPRYGYYVNTSKTKLLLHSTHSTVLPIHDHIQTVTDGLQILGAPIGNEEYMESITSVKVDKWIRLINRLTDVASIDPQVAFCCMTKSTQWKWSHFSRTTPCRSSLLEPLREAIDDRFVPTMLRREVPSCMADLLSSPFRYGGIGIERPDHTEHQLEWSKLLCESYHSDVTGDILRTTQKEILGRIRIDRDHLYTERMECTLKNIPGSTANAIKFAREQRPPVWLSTIPLSEDQFHLSGDEFRDAVSLRYNWDPPDVPNGKCFCGQGGTLSHMLSCKTGASTIIRHNAIRDILAHELTKVCHAVELEPRLKPLNGDIEFENEHTCRENDARADVACNGLFQSRFERTFIDVVVFNNLAPSCSKSAKAAFQYHESRKRTKYGERITAVERGIFLPAVFSISGSMGQDADRLLKNIAKMQNVKIDQQYSGIICQLRRKIGFALIQAASQAIRGSRSTRGNPHHLRD